MLTDNLNVLLFKSLSTYEINTNYSMENAFYKNYFYSLYIRKLMNKNHTHAYSQLISVALGRKPIFVIGNSYT